MDISKESTFKLVGFINMFKIFPDFVWPIYQGENRKMYYAEGRKEDYTIKSFVEVNSHGLEHITLFETNIVSTNQVESIEVSIGSKFVFLFQVSEDFVQIGDYYQMKEYLEHFETEDEILKKRIILFVDGILV